MTMDSSSWSKYGNIDPALEASMADYGSAADFRSSIAERTKQQLSSGIVKPINWNGVSRSETQIPVRDGSSIYAAVYSPETTSPGPLCVYFHGGGWTVGGPKMWEVGFEVLTKQCGITVASVAYRLAPEHAFPTAAEDACDALKWCVENAESLGADPRQGVIVAGTSAGGNLAAVAAHDAVERELEPKIAGVVLMSAQLVHADAVPERFQLHYKSREEHKNALVLDERSINWFCEQYKPDTKSPLASPLIWPSGHGRQPPTYLQVMGMDPVRDDSLIYEHILREEFGIPTKLDIYAGYPHTAPGIYSMLPIAGRARADLRAGVEWILSQKAK